MGDDGKEFILHGILPDQVLGQPDIYHDDESKSEDYF